MTQAVTVQELYNEIRLLKEDITFIKKHMFDPDSVMTSEEAVRFEESMEELKSGKTTSLKQMKKDHVIFTNSPFFTVITTTSLAATPCPSNLNKPLAPEYVASCSFSLTHGTS